MQEYGKENAYINNIILGNVCLCNSSSALALLLPLYFQLMNANFLCSL